VIKTRKQKEEVKEPKIKSRTVDRKFLGIKFGERKEQYLDYEKKTVERNESYVDYEKKTVERDETYIDYVEKTIERVETRIVDYEEEVIGTVQVVVAQIDKVVGTEYLTGGYSAIQLLLGIGLGVQSYCSHQNHSPNFSACIKQGRLEAELCLAPFKSKIEQLVDNPKGERELIQREQQLIEILEQACELVN
jgi:hypothetical protein